MIEGGNLESGAGGLETRPPREDYYAAVLGRLHPARRLKVVVAAGNGVAGIYAPELLRRLGCEVVELFCESDGRFPNHLPDPEDPETMHALQAKVPEVGADLGIAYDGDADRVGVVDERGRRHEADLILVLLARARLPRPPGAQIVSTSSPRSRSSTTSARTAAYRSCGRPATPTSNGRCARTGSCSGAR